MKQKVLRWVTVLAIILVLTMGNFILVAKNSISYAKEVLDNSNNKNIEFLAYFKTETGEKVNSKEEFINNTNLKLYMHLIVKEDGYFNGKIELQNANFNLKPDILSNKVNSIQNNTIILNQINAGENVEIEVGIDTNIDYTKNTIETNKLNSESTLALSGTYVNSKKTYNDILATSNVNLKLVSPQDINMDLKSTVLLNKIYEINNDGNKESKRIVEILLESGLENNQYPISTTAMEIAVPQNVENVQIASYGTYSTNNNHDYQFSKENWTYDKEKNQINITIKNKEENNQIVWNKTEKDKILITYIFDDEEQISNFNMNVKNKIELTDGKSLENNYEIPVNLEQEVNETFSFTINENEEIYKGKLYSKENRTYTTTNNVQINYADKTSKLVIEENIAFDTMVSNIDYVSTKINKEEVKNILGNTGYLVIKDINGNELTRITKDTEADSEKNIVFNYEAGIQHIIIEIYGAETTGILNIINNKKINSTDYTRENIMQINKIIENTKGTYYLGDKVEKEREETKEIQLKETETKAKIEINNNILSTYAKNENIEIKATLVTNNESKDLYKNPTVQIVLPNIIENIDIKTVKLMYAEELKVTSAKLDTINGEKVISIAFEGEQTKYTDLQISEGPTIVVNADIDINKKTLSQDSAIRLIYTNENDKNMQEQEECKIQIVSPREILTVNSINTLGLETVGEEETKKTELEVNSQSKDLQMQVQIANNAQTDISNVKILGNLPTQGAIVNNEENNMPISLAKDIQVSTLDTSNLQIYYTQNAKANDSLENAENGWGQDSKNAKKYLIVVDNMQKGQTLTATYDVNIAENLYYKEQAKANYEVSYNNNETGRSTTIEATPVAIATSNDIPVEFNQDQLDFSLTSSVGGEILKDDDTVKAGERIKYTAKITNNSDVTVQNLNITSKVPDNTVYVELEVALDESEEGQSGNIIRWKEIEDKKDVQFTIDSLAPGETIIKEYEVNVKTGLADGTAITTNAQLTGENISKESSAVNVKTKEGDIVLTLTSLDDISNDLKNNKTYEFALKVRNTSDKDKKNVKIDIGTTGLIKVVSIEHYPSDENTEPQIVENTNTFTINKLPANEVDNLIILVSTSGVSENNYTTSSITAKATIGEETYRSNEFKDEFESILLQATQTANNEGEALNKGDRITYSITLSNKGSIDANNITFYDDIPSQLTVKKVTRNGEVIETDNEDEIDNGIYYNDIQLPAGSSIVFEIETEATDGYIEEDTPISNIANVKCSGMVEIQSNEVKHILLKNVVEIEDNNGNDDDSDDDNNNDDNTGDNNNNENNQNNNSQNNVDNNNQNNDGNGNVSNNQENYKITGLAWLDNNGNGSKDTDEQLLKGISVKLYNTETNTTINNVSATTDDNGTYTLNNILKGKYIVIFEYDTEKYILTTYKADGVSDSNNSKVVGKELNIDGQTKTVGTTDIIEINSSNIYNINIGLKEAKNFDLKLDKYISKIIVQNSSGTKTYDYTNKQLAKIDIAAKQLKGTNLIMTYTMKVTNAGEVAGYVKSISDTLPKDLKFSSELNKDWYESNSYLYNTSLENTKLEPGQTQEVSLVLTKTMTDTNTGTTNNIAEIAKASNDLGIADINSTPGNGTRGENDMSSADVMISIKTGAMISYITLTLSIIIIVGMGAYFISKKVLKIKI